MSENPGRRAAGRRRRGAVGGRHHPEDPYGDIKAVLDDRDDYRHHPEDPYGEVVFGPPDAAGRPRGARHHPVDPYGEIDFGSRPHGARRRSRTR